MSFSKQAGWMGSGWRVDVEIWGLFARELAGAQLSEIQRELTSRQGANQGLVPDIRGRPARLRLRWAPGPAVLGAEGLAMEQEGTATYFFGAYLVALWGPNWPSSHPHFGVCLKK
jgi:hypothetical protein